MNTGDLSQEKEVLTSNLYPLVFAIYFALGIDVIGPTEMMGFVANVTCFFCRKSVADARKS